MTEKEREMVRLLAGTLNALGMDKDTLIIILEAMYPRTDLMYKLMQYIVDHPMITADEAERQAVKLIG